MSICHSASFISRFEKLVPAWVELVVKGNTLDGLGGIVRQTHGDGRFDPLLLATSLLKQRNKTTNKEDDEEEALNVASSGDNGGRGSRRDDTTTTTPRRHSTNNKPRVMQVKIVLGDGDMLCGAATGDDFLKDGGRRLADAAGGTVDFLPGGHNVLAERPKEWQRNLLEFLRAPENDGAKQRDEKTTSS